ncbi:hypothetical protein MTR67_003157 [Solanum verrucosum]|uniref:Uncharacterized protein n=1 Tax=Solanum verrucosum TaxID=315347 RepID=A0AAF0T6M3_SOLVR|nr:hypothetical protein MTR67_003157 [Solanum verrucosum]
MNVGKNVEQEVPNVMTDPLVEKVTNAESETAFQVLAQAMMAKSKREANVLMNPNVSTAEAMIRDFIRMNPLEFHGSMVDEDPLRLRGQSWTLINIRVLQKFGSTNGRNRGRNLCQGNMSVKECALNFTQLARYAPTMVADSRARMRGNCGGNGSSVPTCQSVARVIRENALMSSDNFFNLRKSSHQLIDFPFRIDNGKDGKHAPPSGLGSSAPKQN